MSRGLSSKGLQTRAAIEQAARKLFAERGFHGTTLADITAAAGKSPGLFYRYFEDKEDLLAALAESFLHDVVEPSGLRVHLPESPLDSGFFVSVVTAYWNMFKQNIGIMIAVAQLAATSARFAALQNEFRRFGMEIVAGTPAELAAHMAKEIPRWAALVKKACWPLCAGATCTRGILLAMCPTGFRTTSIFAALFGQVTTTTGMMSSCRVAPPWKKPSPP